LHVLSKIISFGINLKRTHSIVHLVIETMEFEVLITVTFNYPANAKKPLSNCAVETQLSRMAGGIGYNKAKVLSILSQARL